MRIEPDPHRDVGGQGRKQDQADGRADHIDRPLDRAGGLARRWVGGRPEQRHPFDRMDGHARPDELEQARDEIDLNREVAQLAQQGEQLSIGSLENAMTTRSTSRHLMMSGRRSGPPRIARCSGRSARRVFGSRSTKPTTFTPYSGCLYELARDQLPDLSRADDQGVLLVGAATRLARPARERPCERQDAHGQEPRR